MTDLYSTYERINSVSPRTLLKIVLYSYMNGDYSSRSMELNCKRDINFMFLLEGAPVPDHATFARFRSIHFAPCAKRILAEMSNALFDLVFAHGIGKRKTPLKKSIETPEEHLKFKYKNVTTDSGYESEENDAFLEEKGQLSYIKPTNYEISKTRRYKNDIGKIENMEYDAESDVYICRNAKRLTTDYVRHSKSKTGYVSEKTIYKCEDCNGCPYKAEFIKGNNCKTPLEERTKTLQVARTFLKYRQEDLKRILTDEGIVLRINRSIQAEGSFGDLKQDMHFRRYISKGTSNVLAESILLAMARNINKLPNKIQKGRTGTHLFPVKSA